MHAIDVLLSGVRGAESGTAEIFARGSNSPIAWYDDFEGSSQNVAGTTVNLDSNGGASVYVNQLARVRVRSLLGTLIRDFVEGDNDNSVEVVSPSFTGTDYDTGQVAANKPVPLGTVLDRWLLSSGSVVGGPAGTDWNVLFRGGPSTIQAALAHIRYFSVKAYGAIGDDTADDSGAIQAAIDAAEAAGGGWVYFPPGIYFTSTTGLTLKGEVSLVGDHANECVIRSTTTGVVISVVGDGERWQTIQGLTIYRSAAQSNAIISSQSGASFVRVAECVLGGPNDLSTGNAVNAASQGEMVLEKCLIQTLAPNLSLVAAGGPGTLRMHGCRVEVAGGYNSGASAILCVVQSTAAYNYIEGCWFEVDAAPANGSGVIRFNGQTHVVARGNTVNGHSGFTGILVTAAPTAAGFLHESQNRFITSLPYIIVLPTTFTAYNMHLASRKGRKIQYSIGAAGNLDVDVMQYDLIEVTTTHTTGTVNIRALGILPDGDEVTVHVINAAGATSGNIDFNGTAGAGSGSFLSPGGTFTIGNGANRTQRFVSVTRNSAAGLLSSYAVAPDVP